MVATFFGSGFPLEERRDMRKKYSSVDVSRNHIFVPRASKKKIEEKIAGLLVMAKLMGYSIKSTQLRDCVGVYLEKGDEEYLLKFIENPNGVCYAVSFLKDSDTAYEWDCLLKDTDIIDTLEKVSEIL